MQFWDISMQERKKSYHRYLLNYSKLIYVWFLDIPNNIAMFQEVKINREPTVLVFKDKTYYEYERKEYIKI